MTPRKVKAPFPALLLRLAENYVLAGFLAIGNTEAEIYCIMH
ncbi:hypothetical protein [Aerosakkonema funiforme]|nr:hypothetical protein [Aerosakkonema funiforme]